MSVALDLAIACLISSRRPAFNTSHPVVARAALTLLGARRHVFITLLADTRPRTSISRWARRCQSCCSGLSFLTGASGQISLGKAPSWRGRLRHGDPGQSSRHDAHRRHASDRRGVRSVGRTLVGSPADATSGSDLGRHDTGLCRRLHLHPQFAPAPGPPATPSAVTVCGHGALMARRSLPFAARATDDDHPSISPTPRSSSRASPSSSWRISSRAEPAARCASSVTTTLPRSSSGSRSPHTRHRLHRVLGVRRTGRRALHAHQQLGLTVDRTRSRSRSRSCRSS